MKAAVVTDKGVQFTDAPKPAPKGNEILIKVKAASLNRADLAVASGHAHGRIGGPGTIVGLECAGEVEAVGPDVKDFKPGDRVMSSAAGGFAEYALTDAGRAVVTASEPLWRDAQRQVVEALGYDRAVDMTAMLADGAPPLRVNAEDRSQTSSPEGS